MKRRTSYASERPLAIVHAMCKDFPGGGTYHCAKRTQYLGRLISHTNNSSHSGTGTNWKGCMIYFFRFHSRTTASDI